MQGTNQIVDNYSLSELFEAFERVDDIAYPEKATSIYSTLLRKSGKSPQQLCQHYQANALRALIGNASLLSDKSGDSLLTNREVVAKITRMQMMI